MFIISHDSVLADKNDQPNKYIGAIYSCGYDNNDEDYKPKKEKRIYCNAEDETNVGRDCQHLYGGGPQIRCQDRLHVMICHYADNSAQSVKLTCWSIHDALQGKFGTCSRAAGAGAIIDHTMVQCPPVNSPYQHT